jgi:hypothetical protein
MYTCMQEERAARLAEAALDKERGNELFKARKYSLAVESYTLAIEKDASQPAYVMNR